MAAYNPFDPIGEGTLDSIVRWLEHTWVLGLVSFLPARVQQRIVAFQESVLQLLVDKDSPEEGGSRRYVELHEPNALHFTQLLLRYDRQASREPIEKTSLTVLGKALEDVVVLVQETAAQTAPFKVCLDATLVAGTLIALLGQCEGQESVSSRHNMLKSLSEALPGMCNVSPRILNVSERGRESNPEEFQEVHCTVGLMKREMPQGYSTFANQIREMELEPMEFSIESVSLVHTRYLSYAFPQEGMVTFPLGRKTDGDPAELIQELHFA